MIPRYEQSDISRIWNEQNKFETFFKVEKALLKVLEEKNVIPLGTENLFKNIKIDPARIKEIEQETKHDIIAFCTAITEQVNDPRARFFHFGVTSSDIIDTALSLQIKESLQIVLKELSSLKKELFSLAEANKNIIAMGRSHGMLAEPMSFGVKLLGHFAEFSRREKDLVLFYQEELTGQLSGAVGNYTVLNPDIEKEALELLGLTREPVSTQVIPRDRLAKLITIFAGLAGAIERVSVEIRHLHRSEVGEIFEGFSKKQKGSSAMPHKKNPVSAENLTGIARVIRSHVMVALENNILWHERDISHSSAERLYLPDAFGLTVYALKRLKSAVQNLVINQKAIEKRVEKSTISLSSYYLHQLLTKTELRREELYLLIQEASFKVSQGKGSFEEHLKNFSDRIDFISTEDLKKNYLAHAEDIFKRVLQEYPLDLFN